MSDCLSSLWIVLAGGICSFVQLSAFQRQRGFAAVLPSVTLFAAAFAASCVTVCATSPPCPRGYDLNCEGRSKEVYAVVAILLFVSWLVSTLIVGARKR
jgi:hypothetical protein